MDKREHLRKTVDGAEVISEKNKRGETGEAREIGMISLAEQQERTVFGLEPVSATTFQRCLSWTRVGVCLAGAGNGLPVCLRFSRTPPLCLLFLCLLGRW